MDQHAGKYENILLTFVGANDSGNLVGKEDGAILTALKEISVDKIYLLLDTGNENYLKIARYICEEILKRGYAKDVIIRELPLTDVSDHNNIYSALRAFTAELVKNSSISYAASITSGTPAMQVCWILLAESGDFSLDFPLKLIRIREPKFGTPCVIPVKLDSSLPQIKRLKKDLFELSQELNPTITINKQKGAVFIGGHKIPFSPVEFCYFRYFAERARCEIGFQKFSGIFAPEEFLNKIIDFHRETFPDLELLRLPLEDMKRKNNLLTLTTFRGNISKVNKKVQDILKKPSTLAYCLISSEGIRGAKYYGIRAEKNNILII